MPLKGIVFDLQRFSLHDGPGIRTTVFLKGCPLRCSWCHNPESQRWGEEIAFHADRCQQCGACIEACPNGAQMWLDGRHIFDRAACLLKAECVSACDFGALQRCGAERTVAEILDETLLDLVYYQESNGGLTLSGGEPLAQARFSRDLLAGAKELCLHTCVETCGYAPQKTLETMLPLVDLWLFDYKITDPVQHKVWTGASNAQILRNLDFLLCAGARMRLRCPIVPGINDTLDHFHGIVAMERKYPQLEAVEIMPYHNTARPKYARYGYRNPLPDIPPASQQEKERYLDVLRDLGSKKTVLG